MQNDQSSHFSSSPPKRGGFDSSLESISRASAAIAKSRNRSKPREVAAQKYIRQNRLLTQNGSIQTSDILPNTQDYSRALCEEPSVRSKCQRSLFALLIPHTCARAHLPPTKLAHVVMDANAKNILKNQNKIYKRFEKKQAT